MRYLEDERMLLLLPADTGLAEELGYLCLRNREFLKEFELCGGKCLSPNIRNNCWRRI